ncbi:MAG: ABC transporter ATP-binding protein [Erysipelotrichaceae bacterium]|nr:ABC transporter ATP-binding protein [Erysipelotrichaceae bacterium]MBQ2655029.1 ABC transporter ATP-binding protein [Erysipelotrichaceae bacterium]
MFKRFISYYKPYLKTFALDMSCALGNSAVAVLYPILTRYMLNDLIPNRKFNLILIFGGVLLVAYVLKMLMKYSVDYFGHMVGTHMQADMRKEIFSKLEKLPFSYFDNNETGQIMSRITNDLQEISELAHHGPETLVMTSFSLIFSLFYLSSINITLALIVFACSPLLVIITVIVRKKHLESSRKARRSLSKINGDVNSSISGIRITKAFNNADKEIEKFETGNKAFVEAKRGQYFTMAIQHASTVFVTDIFNVVVLISGGIFLYNGQITFGDYSTFIVSVNMFTSPILQLVQWMEQFDEGVTGFERFCEILDLPIEEDKKEAITLEKVNGDICFDNVSFSYNHDEDREVLDHISFVVPQGKTVALVGPSGGGKTTICHLLPKFYHPDAGVISIDGTDIEDITMESLRENIGIVQQDVFLFSGSFADNIAYGRNDASFEEIVEAAKKANIYDYIMSLPDTFDTQIGERGVRLSGGQKQRLSIARVFLKNPSILILDEATSALDNTTEALIQEALNTLKKGRTTIVVAHRLSTIKNADQILVVANGKIRESGTHNELIKDEKGIYKKLYESQFLESDFGIDSKMMMS